MGKVAKAASAGPPELPASAPSRTARRGLTVQEVLGASTLAGARVIAGEAGLSRLVERLNVMEVPDILPWVKPHELLLTTGYPLRHTPQALADLVGDLDDRGLAALAIKLHRYIDDLPAAMLAEADRRGFPIILVPDGVGFDDILNQVLTDVIDRQAAMRERAEEVHRVLVQVVLDGGGPHELVHELARVLAGPVMVTTPDGRVVAQAGDAETLAALADSGYFDASGRFFTEREPAGQAQENGHVVVPIVSGRVDHGRIVAFAHERQLDEGDVHTLERAATVAALAITKQQELAAVESKYRGDFLRDLISGRVDEPVRAVAHCASLGWDINRPLVVVVAEIDPEDTPAGRPQLRPAQERFAAAWQTVLRPRDPKAPVVGFLSEVVALLATPPHGDVERLVRDVVHEVSGDGGGGRRPFATGVSRTVTMPAGIPTAYAQARKAVRVARQLQGPGAIAHFDQLGVFRLLSQIPDSAELRDFAAETLGPLADDGDSEMVDLRHTLQVLLETNMNIAEAARQLHFHYNTLRYRTAKLERLLGPFTEDPNLRLDLALALKVVQMRSL